MILTELPMLSCTLLYLMIREVRTLRNFSFRKDRRLGTANGENSGDWSKHGGTLPVKHFLLNACPLKLYLEDEKQS